MRLPKRSRAGLLTCLTLVVVPVLPAQTASGQASGRSAPGDTPATRLRSKPQVVRSNPYANTAAHSVLDKTTDAEQARIAHLRRAAEHLKAAGKPELASRLMKEALLEAKLNQIRKLQAEVDHLRRDTATDRSITLRLKIMELQVSRMRKLGFDLQTADEDHASLPVGWGAAEGFIAALQKHDLVKVLAEPTLVTVSGRPATFQSGGEFPIIVPQSTGQQTVEYRQFGTRLDCLAVVLDDGRIRLELRPSVSEIDASRSVIIGGNTVPGLRVRWMDFAADVEAGQTLLFHGPSRSDGDGESTDGEETALIVTVTANLGVPAKHAAKGVEPVRR